MRSLRPRHGVLKEKFNRIKNFAPLNVKYPSNRQLRKRIPCNRALINTSPHDAIIISRGYSTMLHREDCPAATIFRQSIFHRLGWIVRSDNGTITRVIMITRTDGARRINYHVSARPIFWCTPINGPGTTNRPDLKLFFGAYTALQLINMRCIMRTEIINAAPGEIVYRDTYLGEHRVRKSIRFTLHTCIRYRDR